MLFILLCNRFWERLWTKVTKYQIGWTDLWIETKLFMLPQTRIVCYKYTSKSKKISKTALTSNTTKACSSFIKKFWKRINIENVYRRKRRCSLKRTAYWLLKFLLYCLLFVNNNQVLKLFRYYCNFVWISTYY